MKLSIILASALGFSMVDIGVAAPSETERKQVSFSVSKKPIEPQRAQMLIHRPNRHQSANESEYENGHQVANSRRHSSVRFRGLKRAFPSRISPPGVRLFIFSPRRKAWGAYLPNGRLVGYGRASGGAGWCRDIGRSCRTPRGTYTVHSLGGPACKSGRYPRPRGGAPMPYCMFFSKNYAIHGSPDVPNYNASHGCIRVKPVAARWLRYNFIKIGTRVIVTSY